MKVLTFANKETVKEFPRAYSLNPEEKQYFTETDRAAGVASIQTGDLVVILDTGNLEKREVN